MWDYGQRNGDLWNCGGMSHYCRLVLVGFRIVIIVVPVLRCSAGIRLCFAQIVSH